MKDGVSKSTPPENEARAFVQHIVSCIEDSLSPAAAKNVTPDDKAALQRALRVLRPSFDELAKCFFDPVREQKPAFCEHGYYMLWSLISAAFVAGSRGTISDSAQRYTNRVKARKGQRTKVKQYRMDKLKEVLAERYSSRGWNKDEREARNVRPYLLEKLSIHEDKHQFDSVSPKLETVRKYLLEIDSV